MVLLNKISSDVFFSIILDPRTKNNRCRTKKDSKQKKMVTDIVVQYHFSNRNDADYLCVRFFKVYSRWKQNIAELQVNDTYPI